MSAVHAMPLPHPQALLISSLFVKCLNVLILCVYGKWSVQTSIDTHVQCSHTSVGLAQGRPNYLCNMSACSQNLKATVVHTNSA